MGRVVLVAVVVRFLGAREPWRWPVRAGCMLTVGSGIAITYWRVGKCVEWEELELELDKMGVG